MGYGNSVDRYFVLQCKGGLSVDGYRNARELAEGALRLHFREEGFKESAVDSFNDHLQKFVDGICGWEEE